MNKIELIKFIDKKIIFLSIIGWLGLAVFLVIFIIIKRNPYDFTVTNNYWNASHNWIIGEPLNRAYASSGFLYFPQSAILQIPFALLPVRLAQALWLILNIFLLSLSCSYIVKLWKNVPQNILFFFVSTVTIALSYDSLRNGQLNITLTVLSVFAAYNLIHKKYKICIVLCLLGVALKPLMIIPLLLVVGVYPKRCLLTAVFGIVIMFILPFLCQYPDYVIEQYKNTLTVFIGAQNLGHARPWADFFGMLKLFGLNVGQIWIYAISIISGIILYIYCLIISRKRSPVVPIIVIASSISFILLFSGRTEMNTYCMIGPFMGFFIFASILISKNYLTKWIYFISSMLCWFFIFGANAVSGIIMPSLKNIDCPWTAPLAFVIFSIYTSIYLIPGIMTDDFKSKYLISE